MKTTAQGVLDCMQAAQEEKHTEPEVREVGVRMHTQPARCLLQGQRKCDETLPYSSRANLVPTMMLHTRTVL